MQKHLALLVVSSLVFALSGCSSTIGNDSLRTETKVSASQKITAGETTQEEIRIMFGSPSSTSYTDGGLTIWRYELTKLSWDAASYIPVVDILAGSSSGTKKELTILFNDK